MKNQFGPFKKFKLVGTLKRNEVNHEPITHCSKCGGPTVHFERTEKANVKEGRIDIVFTCRVCGSKNKFGTASFQQ